MTCPPCTNDCNEGRDCPAKNKQMKPYGYVWTKDKHSPMFFWTESHAKEILNSFGGEVVPVFK